ncbi:ABC transporter substrate-binding protein [Catenulispora yoronensis]|uniref:ABC transporter substrate-binding protein n=1 Tax=Catenulispora yoronensis TaxID=450799 RepID=A0ABP5GKW6_9ACTN
MTFTMSGNRKGAAILALALTAAVGLAGCSSDSKGGSSSGAIKIGGLFTLTPQAFGNDAQKMVQAVFDRANAQGGVNGHKIEYTSGDDAASPTTAAALVRKYVGDGAVAMVGSVSFVDCGTNHAYYQQQKIMAISAIGADPFCYSSPNIAPVNIGPFTSVTADLYYATKYLNAKKVCIFMAPTPGTKDAQAAAVDRWTKATGVTPTVFDSNVPLTETNFTPYLLRAKDAGCDSIFRNGSDTTGLSILKAAANQGMQNVNFLFDASSYTAQLASSASSLNMKVYLASEFEPYTSTSDANADWRSLAQANKINETAFTQGAYVSAEWILQVLKDIKGPITRDTVTAALKAGTPYNIPMVGSPLVFGPADAHAPNQAIKMVTIKDGTWQTLNPDFFQLPAAS